MVLVPKIVMYMYKCTRGTFWTAIKINVMGIASFYIIYIISISLYTVPVPLTNVPHFIGIAMATLDNNYREREGGREEEGRSTTMCDSRIQLYLQLFSPKSVAIH